MNPIEQTPSNRRAELEREIVSYLHELPEERLAEFSANLAAERERARQAAEFLEQVTASVPEKWRAELISFTESGEASPEFIALLDSNPNGPEATAVNRIMERQAEGLRGLAQALSAAF